jgi:hypothetical protein
MSAISAPLSSVQIGDISITYLPDGIHHVRPLAQYDGADEAFWASRGHVLDEDGWLVMSIGSLLVRNGDSKMLIDLGFGPASVDIWDLTNGEHQGDLVGGDLLQSLAAVNLAPADIDAVLFTHLHPDHDLRQPVKHIAKFWLSSINPLVSRRRDPRRRASRWQARSCRRRSRSTGR